MTEQQQPEDSPRVAALIVYLRKSAVLIDRAGAASQLKADVIFTVARLLNERGRPRLGERCGEGTA